MKHSVLFTMAIAFGVSVMACWSAAGSVFSDDFTTDTSLAVPPWYNINNTSAATATLNPGVGLALTVTSGTGKTDEEFAQFASSPFSIANVGSSITLTVNFSGTGLADNGYLMGGLFNTQGTPGNADEVSTDTTGATADDTGYFGEMGMNTGANGSNKFYSRAGGYNNELLYYSHMGGGYTQVGSSMSASGNANLVDSTPYIFTLTIANTGSGNDLNFAIGDGTSTLDSWTVTDSPATYNSFDELAFGAYGKAGQVNLNITSVSVDYVQGVPEPSMFAFAGLGLVGLLLRFRRR